jgi:hypothetical protein
MPTARRCARLLLIPGVISLGLPAAVHAADRLANPPTESQIMHRWGKPSERDRVWQVAPRERDYDRDGLSNKDDWDDDNDGLIDEDEDQ